MHDKNLNVCIYILKVYNKLKILLINVFTYIIYGTQYLCLSKLYIEMKIVNFERRKKLYLKKGK